MNNINFSKSELSKILEFLQMNIESLEDLLDSGDLSYREIDLVLADLGVFKKLEEKILNYFNLEDSKYEY